MVELVRRLMMFGVVVLAVAIARDARGDEPLDPKAVPAPLRPWIDWTLRGKERALCPTLDGIAGDEPHCAWPARLELALDEKRGAFTQRWHLDARAWVPLPGDDKRWPQETSVDGKRSVVIDRSGVPSIELDRGDHVVRGSFAWDSLPESLKIPKETALLSLVLRGKRIDAPNRDASGTVWLEKSLEAAEGERLDFVVHRRIVDEIPVLLTTRIVLNVAGKNREIVLGKALPAGFVPMALDSQLPARVEPDTRLRVQARPGSWTIELVARSEGPVEQIERPNPDGPWRTGEEVWVFDARTHLRLADVQGPAAIDPQQTSLPEDWKKLPAYPVAIGDKLRLVEKRRGDADPGSDQLSLQRTLWLDFDGKGFTASDTLTGRLRRASRLEALPPTVLGRVAIGGKDQFITHLDGDPDKTGVELRQGELNVAADSRILAGPSDLPAVGYDHDFHSVSATLHLPPGFRLLHASGVDDVPSTWIKHWTLLELFVALVLALGVFRLYGARWGAVALGTFALTFPEPGAPKYVLVFVLAAEAIARAIDRAMTRAGEEGPSRGLLRARGVARVMRAGLATILVVVTVPFLVSHVRTGLFPALAGPATAAIDQGGFGGVQAIALGGAKKEASAPAAPPPPPGSMSFDDLPAQTGEAPLAEQETDGDEATKNVDVAKSESAADRQPLGQAMGPARKPPAKGMPTSWTSSSYSSRDVQQFNANVYDPTSIVQTGPGRPRWQFVTIPLTWSGPVARDQRLHLYLLSPAENAAFAVLRALLVFALVVRLLPVRARRSGGVLSFAAAPLALAILLWPAAAHAQAVPPKDVLDELGARLLDKPACAPDCASSSRMLIDARPGTLRLRMEIEAAARTAVALPSSAQWSPETVLVDGAPARSLLRTDDGKVWLAVEKGWHQAILEGGLPERELVQISLPEKPHRVEVQAEGWRIEGIHEDGLADENLQLTRIHGKGAGDATLEPGVLPPFVRVERTLLLGLDWEVSTHVVRSSPKGTAVVLEVPLLPGESVTTADVRVVDGKALINMPPQATEVSWRSVLERRASVVLEAPRTPSWTELWRLDASPIWHVETEGIPVVHAEPEETMPSFRPWPGETTTLHVTKPLGVAGRTLTIDESTCDLRPGMRATDATLTLQVRSSRGAQHTLTLPDGSELESVSIDGKTMPIQADGRKVTIPVSPGPQTVVLKFRVGHGIAFAFRAPEIDLGAPSVNATTSIRMPDGRFILALSGPRLGPVVLFWSLLAIVLVVAGAIGAMKRTPLRTWQWMLLAIGLSQLHVLAAAFVVAWIHVIAWRERTIEMRPISFNLRQIALVGITLVALLLLVASVEQGLLGHPDMQIRGNGSSSLDLRWFSDRNESAPAAPLVVSAPMAVYRIAMLAWALWLALAVIRWLRWGFAAFGSGGFWRRPPPPPPPANLPHRMPPQEPPLEGPPQAPPPTPSV